MKAVMNPHVAQKAANVTSPMIIDHQYLVAVADWSFIQCVCDVNTAGCV